MANNEHTRTELATVLKKLMEQIADPVNLEYIAQNPEFIKRINLQIDRIKNALAKP